MIHASAPGRVNLIGEHTDYNDGYVLPMPIPQRAHVALRPRDDQRVTVWSREVGEQAEYALGEEAPTGRWVDYVQGCTAVLRTAGHAHGGFEIAVTSDVPLGSGLSSSAALEVAILRAVRAAYALPIDDLALALLGQRVETEFVGTPIGAMDQIAASLGIAGAALFVDLRAMTTRPIVLPQVDVLVIASGIQHAHATGEYRVRRAQCEEAARTLGVRALRDLDASDLARVARLPAPLDRRARHVITENARVLAAVQAIAQADLVELGTLFTASHASLRDDFEVSLPAMDQLVELALAEPAVFGARLTGGGFGGSIVALAIPGTGQAAADQIATRFAAATSQHPQVLLAGPPR